MADRVSLPASEPIGALPRSCCRCSNRGRCLDCSCAKSGLPCASCLPSRKGQCVNYSPSATAIDAAPVLLPSTSSSVADGSGARVPGTSGAGESAIVEDAGGRRWCEAVVLMGRVYILGGDSGAHCGVCGRVFTLTRAGLVHIHGPIGNRCPGSRILPEGSGVSPPHPLGNGM